MQRHRRAQAAHHPGLVVAGRGRWRHIPPALFGIAVILLLAGSARPTALMVMPSETRTVILAMDVSGSMGADDVAPTRLDAAKAAARDFIRRVPSAVRIGIVAFSDDANLVQAPTSARDDALAAIDWLQAQHGTAIGSGILASLEAIQPGAPAAVILLTDGQNSFGPDPVEAARQAAVRGVRVYAVGVGTPYGQIRDGIGWRSSVGIDEEAMKSLAQLTGAEYFYASSAPDLREVYARLGSSVVLARIRTEITALMCGLAALLATASAALSLFWFGRLL